MLLTIKQFDMHGYFNKFFSEKNLTQRKINLLVPTKIQYIFNKWS
jgi:hypothetical protein